MKWSGIITTLSRSHTFAYSPNCFLKIAKGNKKTYQIIDSNLSIKSNTTIITNKIDKLIKQTSQQADKKGSNKGSKQETKKRTKQSKSAKTNKRRNRETKEQNKQAKRNKETKIVPSRTFGARRVGGWVMCDIHTLGGG